MVSSGAKYPQRRYCGRFFGRRVNCEYVPQLPAGVLRMVLSDPREIPYLLVWKDERDGKVKEAVRVSAYSEPGNQDWRGWVEIKRTDGSRTTFRTLERTLPRNGGKALLAVCPGCMKPCRALYGWRAGGQYTTSVQRLDWGCRASAGLRYSSEGGALVRRGRGALARLIEMYDGLLGSDRPEPWYPYVFTSVEEAAEAGIFAANDEA